MYLCVHTCVRVCIRKGIGSSRKAMRKEVLEVYRCEWLRVIWVSLLFFYFRNKLHCSWMPWAPPAAWHNELHSHTVEDALQDSPYRAIMSTPVYQFMFPTKGPESLHSIRHGWARLVRQTLHSHHPLQLSFWGNGISSGFSVVSLRVQREGWPRASAWHQSLHLERGIRQRGRLGPELLRKARRHRAPGWSARWRVRTVQVDGDEKR